MSLCFLLDQCRSSSLFWSSWNSSTWIDILIVQPRARQALIAAVQFTFFVGFAALVVRSLSKALPRPFSRKSTVFRLVQLGTLAASVFNCATAFWQLWIDLRSSSSQLRVYTMLLLVSRALAWLSSFFVLSVEERLALRSHFSVLRAWWAASFVVGLVTILAYIGIWVLDRQQFLADIDLLSTAVNFPVSLALFAVACYGGTGITEEGLSQPLVVAGRESSKECTPYEKAGLISKWLFLWMNPLLRTGSQKTIDVADVPSLMSEDKAEALYEVFEVHWLEQEEGKRSVARALFKSRWPQLLITGWLYLLKLSVMYVGPLMIEKFIEFAAKPNKHWMEGVRLVLTLLAAKLIEEVTERQRSFLVWKLSLSIKSLLVTAVFRKSLRLSTSARQSHGTGQIVNYMSVDVEEVSNFTINIHNLWMMPLQIVLALVILFKNMGISTVSGLGTMVALMCICLLISSRQRRFWKEIMACKDDRLKVTNEAISSIKIIKMQAWQDWFLKKVEKAREEERIWSAKLMYIAATSIFFLWLSPLAVSVATFATCVLLGRALTAARVFTAIATFRILQDPLRAFPSVIMASSQATTSLARLKKYFESDEIDYTAVQRRPHGEPFAVTLENAFFKWDTEVSTPVLHDVNLQVKAGSLVAVVGTVGSGKSSLLACILGEMEKICGKIKLSGQLAYVAQSPWIQNGTIQDNILFGKPMDWQRYRETLRACSLESDIKQLIHGDKTVIGERGFNLSGGQKQRIQLARAVYQDADVYLLDDIFSAVDAHTGSSLFLDCIKGSLSSKTVILVTHQIEFLHGADLILVMKNGRIVQSGSFECLLGDGVHFADLVGAHNQALQTINLGDGVDGVISKPPESQDNAKVAAIPMDAKPAAESSTSLLDEEERAKGRVDKTVYWAYITQAFRGFHVLVLLLVQSSWQGFQISSDFWLAYFTSEKVRPFFSPKKFICVYSALALGSGVFVLIRTLIISFTGLLTAQRLYISMLHSVFHAPMSFFDATPTGRILTRSSTDQVLVDFTIPFLYGSTLANGFQLIGVLIVTSKITWQLVLVILPLFWVYLRYQEYFIATSRELTRLKSITDAPIVHHFKETLSGFMTIRAFGHQERFARMNGNRVDTNVGISFHNGAANDWLALRLETIGIVILCSSALFLVVLPKGFVNPANVGLSLSYGLALSGCLNYMIYYISQIEQNMVAVERILQYSSIESEQPPSTRESHPRATWPEHGMVFVENLQIRYRPDLPLVLKNLTFTVQAAEKLGIVGRTGSGKSSFIQALFRLVEPIRGTIYIDGINIQSISLNDLRSRLSIIPQEPTLFEGTVRTNIDPLGIYEDHEIWKVLEKCQLVQSVRMKEKLLDSEVSENGENWSMGQRQLFCLGRVLLKRSRILVLDEATASIDAQTDWILQRIIKEEFQGCSVISIAHRIPSVMDSDKVLVLDNGELKEFGAPSELLENRASSFSGLVHEYWNRSRSAQNLQELR